MIGQFIFQMILEEWLWLVIFIIAIIGLTKAFDFFNL